jgi:3-methylfumaryl-CoA hydratase
MSSASLSPSDNETFSDWVGKTAHETDRPTRSAIARLAALLDYTENPWNPEEIPPLAHWLFFLPQTAEKDLSPDGHPARGGFWPPFSLPRRMWAGGRVRFLKPMDFDLEYERCSTITNIKLTEGKTGKLAFLTLQHEIRRDSTSYIVEEQDIVYRNPPTASTPNAVQKAGDEEKTFDHLRTVSTTPITLFRFSALTYNSHRIHYDETFAKEGEGYEERLVHGPLMAIMLMDHYRRHAPDKKVREFAFRAKQPVFVNTHFDLCLTLTENGGNLSLQCGEKGVAMEASVIAE